MRKIILMILTIITTVTMVTSSSSVLAEDNSAPAASTNNRTGANHAEEFQKRKAKILTHINERLSKVQQMQSCVQAANDMQALRACRTHGDKERHD